MPGEILLGLTPNTAQNTRTAMQNSPNFDAWSIIFLVAAVQGLFIAFVLFRWRRGDRQANLLLALVMLLFSLSMLEYVLFWIGWWKRFPHVSDASSQFPFLFGPLIWLYLRRIYEGKNWRRVDWLHFMPFLAAMVILTPWYLLDADSKRAVFNGTMQHPMAGGKGLALIYVRIAHMVVYAVWNAIFIYKQPRVSATTRWANLLNWFYIGFTLAYASYWVLAFTGLLNPQWDYQVSAMMTA